MMPIINSKKRNFYIIFVILTIIAACSESKKSVTEQLEMKEIAALIKEDSAYEGILQDIESVREKFNEDLVLASKFQNLSYADYLSYIEKTSDTAYQNRIYSEFQNFIDVRTDSILSKYKEGIDKKLDEYRIEFEKSSPFNFFKIDFAAIDKEYYSSLNEIRKIDIYFTITPLKGSIQGGSFLYKIIPKVTNEPAANGACRFSIQISQPKALAWETPYDVEKEFKYTTTKKIRENYDFEYEILTARKDGKTYRSDDLIIPQEFKRCLLLDTLSRADYFDLIKEQYYVEINYFDMLEEFQDSKKQEIDKIAFELERLIWDF